MKKILFLLLAFCSALVFADEIQVKVAVDAERNSFHLKEELVTKAQKSAIRKYILKLDAKAPEKLLAEACNEYSNFVDGVKRVSSEKWTQIDTNLGQLSAEYSVEVEAESVNSWLKEKGFGIQGGIELIIMEEPPSLGQMKMDEAFGTGVNGTKYFMQQYTVFQRRLRDAIVKKVDEFGFDVKLLEDNDLYENFKTQDGTLVGVYFDVNSNKFAVDRDLLKTVKENNPDTLVLYYRIDALTYNPQSKEIRATVAFNFKDLNTNVTKSIGAGDFGYPTNSTTKDEIMSDVAYCAESAMNQLMNAEGMAAKLNSIAMSIKNSANMPKGPMKLIVNAAAFDKKVRKKALYMLKKELIAQQLTTASQVKSTNTTLTATITNPNVKEPDALYMEYVSPILENIGIELEDDKVNYAGNTLNIKP